MEPVIVARFPERSQIVELADTTLMALHATKTREQAVAVRRSDDQGATWSEPYEMMRLPAEPGRWALPQVLVDDTGRIHLFLMNDRNTGVFRVPGEAAGAEKATKLERRIDVWHSRSNPDRTDWEAPKKIWEGHTGSINSAIQTSAGRIILPFAYLTERHWRNRGTGSDDFWYVGSSSTTAIFSDDLGESWVCSPSELKVQTPTLTTYGAIEPVIVELNDGRIWMLIRTQMGRFYQSFSIDGEHWETPTPTSIISSDSPAGLKRLPDGRLVLFWNKCLRYPYAFGGRHVLHAAVSEDEGRTWVGHREVVRDPLRNDPPPAGGDHGTAYPFPVALSSGMVIMVTGQGEGRIALVSVDPDWLCETRREARFDLGLEDWSVFGCRGVGLEPSPDSTEKQALGIRREHRDWPACGVWNFPLGRAGRIEMGLWLRRGFGGAALMLADHYSVPFDPEDAFFAAFVIEIDSEGRIGGDAGLTEERWCEVAIEWDCAAGTARVLLDGAGLCTVKARHLVEGLCYLRLRSTGVAPGDEGFVVGWVRAEVGSFE